LAGIPIYHAFSDVKAEIQTHISLITAYDTLSNINRITDVLTNTEDFNKIN
jgi:hypothetical protein